MAHPSLQGMQWNARFQTSWSFSTSFPQASPVLPRTMLPAQRCPSIVQWAQNHKQVLFINEHFLENGSLWHFDGVSSHWKLWQVRLYNNNNNPTQEALLYLQPISTLSDKTQGHHHYRPRYCGYILLSLLSMSNVRRPRPSPNSHPLFTHSNGPLNFRILCNHISWFSHPFSHIHLLDFDFHILLTISHNQSFYIYIYWIIIGQASFETFWVRLPDLQCGRPSLLWVSGPRPASSATARWCLGSGSNEKQDRQDRQVPTGTSWPVAPEFCNENSSSSCHDDDGRTLATAGIQIELWSNTTAADWKSAAWVFSRTLPAKRDVGWIFHLGCKAVGKIRRTQELPTGGSATSATWECPQHGRGFERHAYPGDPGVEKGTNSNSFGNKRTHTHK